ncbi:MAG TPA: hypothetical protein DHV36_22500 [Desulfobacteraceae bacterium]|nr:hypothetical protein [Desulfobacteraceae bacterium]|tara:strand:+ start:315 stop:725 length:411 start_codon:yes stop_codon:yes gene_type:complete
MNLQIESSIPEMPDWQTWMRNGNQYFKAACPEGKGSRFSADLQYNLLSMSLEGYVMAISGYHNCLPYNHTFTDLMSALERIIPLDPDLKSRILRHESIQDICSIENYHRSHPTEDALADLRSAVADIGELAREICT